MILTHTSTFYDMIRDSSGTGEGMYLLHFVNNENSRNFDDTSESTVAAELVGDVARRETDFDRVEKTRK